MLRPRIPGYAGIFDTYGIDSSRNQGIVLRAGISDDPFEPRRFAQTKERAVDNIRVRLIIEGRVQGVWFRESTRREAVSLGLSGWVRNRPEGSVEAVIEGPEDRVQRLTAWCHKGPSSAGVSRVHEQRQAWTGEFSGFDVAY